MNLNKHIQKLFNVKSWDNFTRSFNFKFFCLKVKMLQSIWYSEKIAENEAPLKTSS